MVHQLCCEIALEPLCEAEVAEYLATQSSGTNLPDGLASLLYQQSEGNPLFIVAALNDMTERGLISRESRNWQLGVAPQRIDLGVPKNLEQMIEVQIDQLDPEQRRGLWGAHPGRFSGSRLAVGSAPVINVRPVE